MKFTQRTKLPLLLVASVLCACAVPPAHLAPSQQVRIKTVAIISLIPEKVTVARSKYLGYGGDQPVIDLAGRIAETVESVSASRIRSAKPNWSIERVEYDRAELFRKSRSGKMVNVFYEERIEPELAELARSNHLDAIFVVSPLVTQRFGPPPWYQEVGVEFRATTSKLSGGVVFADIGVFIVGADGKILVSPHWDSADPKELDPQELGIGDSGPIAPAVADRLSQEVIGQVTRSLNQRFDQIAL